MKRTDIDAAAGLLVTASSTRVPAQPLSLTFPGLSVDDAYVIQLRNNESRRASGAKIVGHKVGLTSLAMQTMLGVDEPDFGAIFDDTVYQSGDVVPVDQWLQPRVEIEIAFRLSAGLTGGSVTRDDVLAATEAVAPSLEIIDSRIADWKITLADTVADNASSAAIVVGDWVPIERAGDLAATAAALHLNGKHVASGRGEDVLGHPAEAVAWLANKLYTVGISLEAGHLVMPGACTKAVDVVAGDHVGAVFDGLGTVAVSFA
jgi:2-keto-4-pentenoate hydratase